MYEEFTCYTDLPSRSYSVAYIDAADSGADYLCALFYKEAEDGNYITDVLYTKDPMEVTETTLTYMLQQHQVETLVISRATTAEICLSATCNNAHGIQATD